MTAHNKINKYNKLPLFTTVSQIRLLFRTGFSGKLFYYIYTNIIPIFGRAEKQENNEKTMKLYNFLKLS